MSRVKAMYNSRMATLSNDSFIIRSYSIRIEKRCINLIGRRIYHNENIEHEYNSHGTNSQCILYNIIKFNGEDLHEMRKDLSTLIV